MATEPAAEDVAALLGEGWALAGDDLAAQARLLTAEAFAGDVADPATVDLVERAIALARDIGDPLTESAALDQLTAIQLARGEVRAGLASALRRIELLAPLEVIPTAGLEFLDSFVMAADCAIAAGDLPLARRLAERLRDLPFHREEGHLTTSRLLVVTVMTGDWTEAVGLAEQYPRGLGTGRPAPGGQPQSRRVRGRHGPRTARRRPLAHDVAGDRRCDHHAGSPAERCSTSPSSSTRCCCCTEGGPTGRWRLMTTPPEELDQWYSGLWRPWYAALWAEAAVLSGREDAADRLDRARRMSTDNPIATAIIDRAAALSVEGGDRDGVDRRGRRPRGRRLSLPVGQNAHRPGRVRPRTRRGSPGGDGGGADGLAASTRLTGHGVGRTIRAQYGTVSSVAGTDVGSAPRKDS